MGRRLPILLAIASGLGVVGAAGVKTIGAPLGQLALFGAAVVVTELLCDGETGRSRAPVLFTAFRPASPVHLAAAIVLGPWPAALLAAGGVLLIRRFRGAAWHLVWFQVCAFGLASLAGGYVFQLAGGTAGHVGLPGDLVPISLLTLAYGGVRAGLLELVYASEPFRLDIGVAAAEAGAGTILAIFAVAHPWNAVALVPLGLAMYTAHVRLGRVRNETFHALETFANIVDERDPSTYQHSLRVAGYVDSLARALRLPFSDIDRLRWAGRLHDLGKVAVDASVLRKPGRLDGAEWAAMRRHPRLSARLLQRFEFTAGQARAVEYHHERCDGNGYYGVAGDDLPLASHFLIVADSFDAMMADRPYRPGLSREQALDEIETNVGAQFHPAVAKAFVAVQRGLDPAAVLSPEELEELRSAALGRRFPAVPRAGDLDDPSEALAVGGIVVALAALAFGRPLLAAAATVAAAAGFSLRAFVGIRAERLGAALRAALAGDRREQVFGRVAGLLEDAWNVTWAGLVTWHEHGLGGSMELSRGAEGPAESPLMSWLVREAESGSDVVVTPGFELGGSGVYLALPLRRENSALVGFLVLHAPRSLPRHVELALRRSLDSLGLAFADSPLVAPPETDSPRVTALAAVGTEPVPR